MGRHKQRYVCWAEGGRLHAQRLVACSVVLAQGRDLPAITPSDVLVAPAGDAAAAAAATPEDWFVLAITSRKKPGKWTFPKGGWETTDGPAAVCAVREASEEAGVRLVGSEDGSLPVAARVPPLPCVLPPTVAVPMDEATVVANSTDGTGCYLRPPLTFAPSSSPAAAGDSAPPSAPQFGFGDDAKVPQDPELPHPVAVAAARLAASLSSPATAPPDIEWSTATRPFLLWLRPSDVPSASSPADDDVPKAPRTPLHAAALAGTLLPPGQFDESSERQRAWVPLRWAAARAVPDGTKKKASGVVDDSVTAALGGDLKKLFHHVAAAALVTGGL